MATSLRVGMASRARAWRPLALAAAALGVVAGSGYLTRASIHTTNDYWSNDLPARANEYAFEVQVVGLAERASRIQATAGGEVSYPAWSTTDEATLSVRTRSGRWPLVPVWSGPLRRGAVAVAGIVPNKTGAVVMAAAGLYPSGCAFVMRYASQYTRDRMSYGWIPLVGDAVMPTPEKIETVSWSHPPVPGRSCGDEAWRPGIALFRFDRKPG